MTLTCFIYSWELLVKKDLPIIIGFGYDEKENKISIAIDDFPLYKYTEFLKFNLKTHLNKKEIKKKRLLRQYLKGEKKIYKIYFKTYSEYASFKSLLFNVDLVSTFLVHQNLNTVGWVSINEYQKNENDHYTTFSNEYKVSYKNVHAKDINNYPEPSVLSFDIECMSHDFESFPNCYSYSDFISTISIVYQYKNIKTNIAICVKYKDKNCIVNREDLNEINRDFISFIDFDNFNNACINYSIFEKNNFNDKNDTIFKKKNNNEKNDTLFEKNNSEKNDTLFEKNNNSEKNDNVIVNENNSFSDKNDNLIINENNNFNDKNDNVTINEKVLSHIDNGKGNHNLSHPDNMVNNIFSNNYNNEHWNNNFDFDGKFNNKIINPDNNSRNIFIMDEPKNSSIKNNNNDTIDNKPINSVIENRYHKFKALLSNANISIYNTKDRYNRFKNMINNSINIDKSINLNNNYNDNNSERNKSSFEPIEEFIKKYEKSKINKQIKNDVLNENYDIIYVETEYDLICEFFNQIRKLDPDLIIGYNTFGFDYKYLAQRAGMYLVIDQNDSPFTANRIIDKPTKFVSNAMNNEVELEIPGRIAIDMFKYAKSLNMSSASLNYVSEQLLNKHKIDLPYKDMFYLIYENTDDSLNKVAMYCIMDSILTLEIFNVSHQWIQLLEIAKISRIRIDEIYKNGQSKKFANLLYKYCEDNDICIDFDNSKINGYKGATVIEPQSGVYDHCTMLDFTSLYPSVIITHNICYTTILKENEIEKYSKDSYHKIDIGDKVYYFTKEHIGILPRMMKILLSERVRYKNLAKKATGADHIIYDKRQYALKIQANSIYGCLGSSSLKYLRFLPGAECTTGMGRNYLNKTINLIENNTEFSVIYGDTDSCLIEYKKDDCEEDDISSNTNNDYSKNKDSNTSEYDNKKVSLNDNENNENTDSINNEFSLQKFIDDSKAVAEFVTNQLPEGMHLKYENTFSRMLIISKKKYSGILANKSELYIKGIDIIKKNTCTFIRDYYKIFLYMILFNYPKKLIRKKVIEMKKELLFGKVPLEKLIMKLSVGPKYVNKSYYVLLFVNNHKRYNLDYKIGEKIDYIIIDTKTFSFNENSHLLGDKIMSLDLYKNICEKATKNNNITKPKLDYNYYYYHYVETGFKSLLKVYDEDICDLL